MDNYQEVGASEDPHLFYELMTSSQAQFVLMSNIDKCRTDEERNQLLVEYFNISSKIFDREVVLASEGWLVD